MALKKNDIETIKDILLKLKLLILYNYPCYKAQKLEIMYYTRSI